MSNRQTKRADSTHVHNWPSLHSPETSYFISIIIFHHPLPPQLFDIPGNLTVCQLSIAGVELLDHGDWTCAVSDSASLETVKQTQSVLVAVVGQLSLSPVLQSVHLAQGDLAQLVCRVTTAWPRPTIAWSIDTPARLQTDTSEPNELEPWGGWFGGLGGTASTASSGPS